MIEVDVHKRPAEPKRWQGAKHTLPDEIHLYPDGAVITWFEVGTNAPWGRIFASAKEAVEFYGINDHLPVDRWPKESRAVNVKPCVVCEAVIPLDDDEVDYHATSCALFGRKAVPA